MVMAMHLCLVLRLKQQKRNSWENKWEFIESSQGFRKCKRRHKIILNIWPCTLIIKLYSSFTNETTTTGCLAKVSKCIWEWCLHFRRPFPNLKLAMKETPQKTWWTCAHILYGGAHLHTHCTPSRAPAHDLAPHFACRPSPPLKISPQSGKFWFTPQSGNFPLSPKVPKPFWGSMVPGGTLPAILKPGLWRCLFQRMQKTRNTGLCMPLRLATWRKVQCGK